MNRPIRIAVAVTALCLAVAPTALAKPAVTTLTGTVGPGFTINLTQAGKKVTRLQAGVPYRFVVTDRSAIHDFHLTGPGLSKQITSVGFTGTKSIVLKLTQGTYAYFCDPHKDSMLGGFKVAPAPAA